MRAALSITCASLSSIFAGVAWLLQLFPLPALGLARWFDRHATRLSSPKL